MPSGFLSNVRCCAIQLLHKLRLSLDPGYPIQLVNVYCHRNEYNYAYHVAYLCLYHNHPLQWYHQACCHLLTYCISSLFSGGTTEEAREVVS